jgi:hypothetical protein
MRLAVKCVRQKVAVVPTILSLAYFVQGDYKNLEVKDEDNTWFEEKPLYGKA